MPSTRSPPIPQPTRQKKNLLYIKFLPKTSGLIPSWRLPFTQDRHSKGILKIHDISATLDTPLPYEIGQLGTCLVNDVRNLVSPREQRTSAPSRLSLLKSLGLDEVQVETAALPNGCETAEPMFTVSAMQGSKFHFTTSNLSNLLVMNSSAAPVAEINLSPLSTRATLKCFDPEASMSLHHRLVLQRIESEYPGISGPCVTFTVGGVQYAWETNEMSQPKNGNRRRLILWRLVAKADERDLERTIVGEFLAAREGRQESGVLALVVDEGEHEEGGAGNGAEGVKAIDLLAGVASCVVALML